MNKSNVLVVDDDKEIVESIAIFLAYEGVYRAYRDGDLFKAIVKFKKA